MSLLLAASWDTPFIHDLCTSLVCHFLLSAYMVCSPLDLILCANWTAIFLSPILDATAPGAPILELPVCFQNNSGLNLTNEVSP